MKPRAVNPRSGRVVVLAIEKKNVFCLSRIASDNLDAVGIHCAKAGEDYVMGSIEEGCGEKVEGGDGEEGVYGKIGECEETRRRWEREEKNGEGMSVFLRGTREKEGREMEDIEGGKKRDGETGGDNSKKDIGQ
ncbi:hypothetical protein D9613_002828 [Agrocybe pediades]|uniref:Uncharacterized protein n=1 Tax=Agrocybe pediades TaxID=84607 RepID=A0A8H4VMM3_9AGAR|nr:hypothetical protein D9613_002828 [Agrocybe pediades]